MGSLPSGIHSPDHHTHGAALRKRVTIPGIGVSYRYHLPLPGAGALYQGRLLRESEKKRKTKQGFPFIRAETRTKAMASSIFRFENLPEPANQNKLRFSTPALLTVATDSARLTEHGLLPHSEGVCSTEHGVAGDKFEGRM